ncbi:MAG: phosphotransferase family protein [Steroidobacteraceae bacterium]
MSEAKTIPPKLNKAGLGAVEALITEWFRAKLSVGRDTAITIKAPSDGYSGDTYVVSIANAAADAPTRYVMRAQLGAANNPESYYDKMVRLLSYLSQRGDMPVPHVRFVEADERIIGGPFFVMDFVEGKPAPDIPPFTVAGWFFDADARDRERAYVSGLAAVARLQSIDVDEAGLAYLKHDGTHAAQTRNHLEYLINLYDVGVDGTRSPLLHDTICWLQRNVPDVSRYVISWGDCRPGNMLFRTFECVAALDWEMCALADPAADIAWWINSDIYYALETGTVLDGQLGREAMREHFARLRGNALDHLDYFQVFSALRIAVIHVHMIQKWARAGQNLFGEGNSLHNNPSTRLVEKVTRQLL